jgi:hypothetical protein
LARVFPNPVVPNNSSKPTPATNGGNAKGTSNMVLTKPFPKNLYRARAYAGSIEIKTHKTVDMIDVNRLNFMANCISFDVILKTNAWGVVCVTTHKRVDRIKTARTKPKDKVRILNLDFFNLSNISFIP